MYFNGKPLSDQQKSFLEYPEYLKLELHGTKSESQRDDFLKIYEKPAETKQSQMKDFIDAMNLDDKNAEIYFYKGAEITEKNGTRSVYLRKIGSIGFFRGDLPQFIYTGTSVNLKIGLENNDIIGSTFGNALKESREKKRECDSFNIKGTLKKQNKSKRAKRSASKRRKDCLNQLHCTFGETRSGNEKCIENLRYLTLLN